MLKWDISDSLKVLNTCVRIKNYNIFNHIFYGTMPLFSTWYNATKPTRLGNLIQLLVNIRHNKAWHLSWFFFLLTKPCWDFFLIPLSNTSVELSLSSQMTLLKVSTKFVGLCSWHVWLLKRCLYQCSLGSLFNDSKHVWFQFYIWLI